MARLGKFRVQVTTEGSKHERGNYRVVEFVINVNMDGEFTTTLDEDQVFELQQSGIDLRTNGRRGSREGYFIAKTKDELCKKIHDVYAEMYSRELISEEKIIRYKINSSASFGYTTDGIVIPNLAWGFDGKVDMERHWQDGTVKLNSSNRKPTGVMLFVKPLIKKVYRYKSGKEVTEYEGGGAKAHHTKMDGNNYYWNWLNNITSNEPSSEGSIREVMYTEETAKFFVELYKMLCKMANLVREFEKPEDIIRMIESGQPLKLNM